MMMETEEETRVNQDILDSSEFGVNVKLFTCILCDQKFTNRVSNSFDISCNPLTKFSFAFS